MPLASDVKVVENVKRIKPGEGLWKTASAVPTDFKIIVPDPVLQEVGGLVVLQNEGKPAQLGFRLKLVNGKIVEAEHMIVAMRDNSNPNRQEADMTSQQAFDMPAMHIYKIWGGQMHEIEAIGIVAPYNSPTGWE